MNETCIKNDDITKESVLSELDQLYQEVQQGKSQGFVLLKVASRDNNGFHATTAAYEIRGHEMLDLIWSLLEKTNLIGALIARTIERFGRR